MMWIDISDHNSAQEWQQIKQRVLWISLMKEGSGFYLVWIYNYLKGGFREVGVGLLSQLIEQEEMTSCYARGGLG